jgi:hypothetical protein
VVEGGRVWRNQAVTGMLLGASGEAAEACAKTTKEGTSTQDAVRGTRFTVHGSRCIVGRDRGAKRECESWTRAGEDGAGSVRAPQRSASLSSKTSKMAARPSSAAQRRWQACFRLAGAAAAGPSADGDESRRRGMVARGERDRERERDGQRALSTCPWRSFDLLNTTTTIAGTRHPCISVVSAMSI